MEELLLSYTGISTFENCPRSFFYRYIEKKFPREESLALGLGSLLHKAKELCSIAEMEHRAPDYDAIREMVLHTGFHGADKSSDREEVLPSVDELKNTFLEDWLKPDEKSGLTYDQKLALFLEHLPDTHPEWRTIGAEVPFRFEFAPNVTFRGFIDLVQENVQGDIRLVDYKTSKKVYDDAALKTPLQFYIYAKACETLFPGRKIAECMYDFILLGETRTAGSPGWMKRAEKKMNRLLAEIAEGQTSGVWKPKPSPLCHWCSYCKNNPSADPAFASECAYYSLWTPENKTFECIREWIPELEPSVVAKHKAIMEFKW